MRKACCRREYLREKKDMPDEIWVLNEGELNPQRVMCQDSQGNCKCIVKVYEDDNYTKYNNATQSIPIDKLEGLIENYRYLAGDLNNPDEDMSDLECVYIAIINQLQALISEARDE